MGILLRNSGRAKNIMKRFVAFITESIKVWNGSVSRWQTYSFCSFLFFLKEWYCAGNAVKLWPLGVIFDAIRYRPIILWLRHGIPTSVDEFDIVSAAVPIEALNFRSHMLEGSVWLMGAYAIFVSSGLIRELRIRLYCRYMQEWIQRFVDEHHVLCSEFWKDVCIGLTVLSFIILDPNKSNILKHLCTSLCGFICFLLENISSQFYFLSLWQYFLLLLECRISLQCLSCKWPS